MDNSALNKAHQQYRRAESHLRYRRFMEAIECHKNASELLNEAISCTQNQRSIESIRLQRDFHLRQRDIILVKKEQFENYRKAIENQRHRIVNVYGGNDFEISNENQSTSLQVQIYRTMEEADSLLGQLIKRGDECESLKSFSTTDTDDNKSVDTIDNPAHIQGSKHPKDDAIVIEELRTLSEQLHSLVYELVTQLDASTREVDSLKDRVKQLESEKNNRAQIKNSTNNLKVITADSSGGTSPYVYSPCSEFSPDVNDQRALPPLEMPNFDFTNFIKTNNVQTQNK